MLSLANPLELITAYQESYPKYYQEGTPNNAAPQGLCIDILHAIEKTTGLHIRAPYGFMPFKRLQAQLANGRIDLFIGMAKNKARLKKYIFIDTPLYEVNHIIAACQNDEVNVRNFEDIRNLAPNNIILTNYSTATERFLKTQEGLNVDSEGTSIAANLKKLLYGRGRFICFHDLGLLGAIERYGYAEDVRVLPLILKTYNHYIAFAPDTPEKVINQIDLAVQKLNASGELAKIRARYVHSVF
jgi:polar amino acid transport system substrate-binding protein